MWTFELPHTPEQLEELATDISDLLDSLDGGNTDGGLALELLLMNVLEDVEEALQDEIRTADMPLTREQRSMAREAAETRLVTAVAEATHLEGS